MVYDEAVINPGQHQEADLFVRGDVYVRIAVFKRLQARCRLG